MSDTPKITDNVVALVRKTPSNLSQEAIGKLLDKLKALNAEGKFTTLCIIGINDGNVIASSCSVDSSIAILGAMTVGSDLIMGEVMDELEEERDV